MFDQRGAYSTVVRVNTGWSCLHWSVYNGNPVVTRALMRAGAASGYKRASTKRTQANKPQPFGGLGYHCRLVVNM